MPTVWQGIVYNYGMFDDMLKYRFRFDILLAYYDSITRRWDES